MRKLLSLLFVATLFSCADDVIMDYKIDKPASLEQYEYLNVYEALKNYVDRASNPNFKLGLAISVNQFLEKGGVYALACSNFDELTAGNAMKYSSVVRDNGAMDFATVTNFVNLAKAANLTIYGHTLAWHSQQNNKYLNSLIKDKELKVDPNAANNFIVYNTGTAGANPWDKQAIYSLPVALEAGADYTLTVDIKASDACQCGLWPIWDASPNKNQWGGSNDVQYLNENTIGTKWDTYTWKFNAAFTHDKLQFVFGKHGGTICFDNLVLVKDGTDANLIKNGDFAEAATTGWGNNWQGPSFEIGKEGTASVPVAISVVETDFSDGVALMGWGNGSTREVVDGVLVINNPSAANFWEAQAGFDVSVPFENGVKYFLKLKVKGSVKGEIRSGFQNPDGYKDCGSFPNFNISTEWKEITISTTCSGDNALRFLFSFGDYGGTIYMDDISIYYEQSMNSIPLTPAEKKDTLTWAMNNWVEGMMKATGGYVTTWDVVNEAIAGGGDDGEGFYPLQSAKNVSAEDAKNNFYWQDYLGSEDYVRIVIAAARKYYAENGGTAPLKLFINDYNLESDWDDNKKAKSLVHWIEKWESDGVTKIDGIGTQMHVSCHANAAMQKSKEEHVVKMFEILAKSGKLVKISELDMGYVDEDGKSVKTADMTEAQHKAMAEYYKFIVKKYFEIIPAAQRYGITQWCATDSPADSGWRGGEPVGLWDANYNRKHTYAGFADGLAGK
ncbi:endo-1,4-beta-xylanase [Bacteroides heparinolyticus]|uniref:endo-1,4-beta-xylanase n=1 Tax=Prevotella heparinolytica TaxID=28113 RepID=UPI0023F89DE0|nr:endo-1,4-beta-xylanase [Bacteroides heparinolyticus]MCI6212024.1 endo-1,4-beta-xylanase [Bacteroides heparinolyticus]